MSSAQIPGSVTLKSEGLEAEISEQGAELVALRDAEGRDLLWNGDPAFWTGRAPLLFPIVGRMGNDILRVDGAEYHIRQHGIARISRFGIVDVGPAKARFRLVSNSETLRAYPFAFELDVTYALEGAVLAISADVRNTGTSAMPVSFGFHPAFRWPLPYGQPREAHEIIFEREEKAPVRRLRGGLLSADLHPNPVEGNRLALSDALFADDALIFDSLESRAVDYRGPDGPAIRVSFSGMPQLGLWSRPGAGFVCIEPWQGFASPDGFDGELSEKPGMVPVAPGDTKRFAMQVALLMS